MTIDIKPFQDKLNLLKEYMFLKIDGNYGVLEFNYHLLPVLHASEILKIFNETGNLLCGSGTAFNPEVKVLSFEEFLKSKSIQ